MPEGKEKTEAQAKYWKDTFPKWAGFLEKLLSANNSGKNEGFFVGSSLTIADLSFFALMEGYLAKNKDCLNDYKVWFLLAVYSVPFCSLPLLLSCLSSCLVLLF
jgi:hypothetical protein